MLPKKRTQKHTKVVPPHYRLCTRLVHPQHQPPEEDLSHILTRQRLLPDLVNLIATYDLDHDLFSEPTDDILTQFILDRASLNFPYNCRISARHPLYSIWHRFILPLPSTFWMVRNYFFEVTQNKFYKLIWLLKVYMLSNETEAVLFLTKKEKAYPNIGVVQPQSFFFFFKIVKIQLLSKPQPNLKTRLGLTIEWLYTTPQKFNFSNISAVTDSILMKL